MQHQTSVALNKSMILGTVDALSDMRFQRGENGELMLKVGQKHYLIQSKLTFHYHGAACRIQINHYNDQYINFSLKGQDRLLLVV
ncbi:hypothetical protein [Snodgrassella sp. B3088]|uniref:hypothetical protein n=1 Tax=Snodgrassella TaxID=1193515 RepID=UPI00226A5904|nr:hypothetical protein [Snodgrassella sp. B3088]MCX8749228.1 hypothetical protein [Snodgrassella sp. B3088]